MPPRRPGGLLAGAADDLVTAARAARCARPGRRHTRLPLRILSPSRRWCPREMVDVLSQLGIRTLADFTALPRRDVAGRFGAEAVYWHRIAAGEPERPVSSARIAAPMEARVEPDDPVADTAAAAFLARQAAVRLHGMLADAGQVCLRLAVRAHLDPPPGYEGPLSVERVWRCREPLTEEDTAQRVRWQLDGWLTRVRGSRADTDTETGADTDSPDGVGGIRAIELVPVECLPAGEVVDALWGGPDAGIRAARAAAARAQALIGTQVRPGNAADVVSPDGSSLPYGESDPEQVTALPPDGPGNSPPRCLPSSGHRNMLQQNGTRRVPTTRPPASTCWMPTGPRCG